MAVGVTNVDLALCGGGLQSGLIVAALCGSGSAGTVALAERERIGGNHTWCFHATDLSPAMLRHIEPFVAHRWDSYEVRFPGYRRVLDTRYAMISSERLRSEVLRMVADRAGSMACEHMPVKALGAGTVRLADGRTLAARTVIDARGAGGAAVPCGFQKFYGEEITLRRGHGLARPIVMDATVAQRDGYRFMYVLPLTPTRALVEDTSFSDGPELDEDERRCGIADWLGEHGWEALRVERTERGVLPMPMAEAPEDLPPRRSAAAGPTVMQGGYRGGWFHPGTGYSLPLAAELAELIATTSGRRPAGGGRRRDARTAAARPFLPSPQSAAVPVVSAGGAPGDLRALLPPSRVHHRPLLRDAAAPRRQDAHPGRPAPRRPVDPGRARRPAHADVGKRMTDRPTGISERPGGRVAADFDRVAASYDLLVGLNPGYRRHLIRSAERIQLPSDARILDLCCGTGQSTLALRAAYPHATLCGLDAAAEMLQVARTRPQLTGVEFVHGDAMDPGAAGVDGPFDGILMAYGIRNVPDADTCLQRVRGLLAPGAPVCFHEYSVTGSPLSTAVWKAVTALIIIPAARVVTGDDGLFRYLRDSVLSFDSVNGFEHRLRQAGFTGVRTLPAGGWQRGIVHSFLARRPEADR